MRYVAALAVLLLGLDPVAAQAPRSAPGHAPIPATVRRVAPGDFPHARHARLFPTCESCHADVSDAGIASRFPDPASCLTCHNGTDAARVIWQPPRRPAPQGLLLFSHEAHARQADSTGRACATCHATPGATRYMDVARARPETCIGCHAHEAPSHYASPARCATCHVPLTQARGLTVDQVRGLPKPPSHDARTFAAAHVPGTPGAAATCAMCHSRESCARCHLNVATLPVASTLGADTRVAAVVRDTPPSWPVPDTHRREDFLDAHGSGATASCANCHARSSCAACHTGAAGQRVIRQLPEPRNGARGVQLRRPLADARGRSLPTAVVSRRGADTTTRVVRPHPRGFVEGHRLAAASGRQGCEGCHTQRFCSDCHAGTSRRDFHPANFVSGHAAATYARDRECASCHNTEVFCRSCHQAVGLRAAGRNAAVFHNGQPQWLLQHGRAARLELQTCTTCHSEATCLRCHATTGWGVNPHGGQFNADRLGRAAMSMCARCHITDPRRR